MNRAEATTWGGSTVHIHTVADRRVKVAKSDGSVGEAMLSQVQAKLLTAANVDFSFAIGEAVYSIRDEEINARRKAGLPDLCEGDCGGTLSMSRKAVKRRSTQHHPWQCAPCASAKHAGEEDRCDLCTRLLANSSSSRSLRRKMPRPWCCASCSRKHRVAPIARAILDDDGVRRAFAMFEAGRTILEIATSLGVSKSQIQRKLTRGERLAAAAAEASAKEAKAIADAARAIVRAERRARGKDPSIRARARQLRGCGYSLSEIAAQLGIAKSTVETVTKKDES